MPAEKLFYWVSKLHLLSSKCRLKEKLLAHSETDLTFKTSLQHIA